MSLVRTLDDIDTQHMATCGGKAARLGEALRLDCPVLPGVVLTTTLYRQFMQQTGLQGEILSILSSMQPTTMTHFQAAEWAIYAAFRVRRIPKSVIDAVHEAFSMMDSLPLAVRSSATNEDSPEQSFVGLHATTLGAESPEALIDAVVACWMSLFSAKALSYAQRFGVNLINASMAVLLQPMVERALDGSLFTADPITGDPDSFVLEVQHGPGVGVYRLTPYERQPGELPMWTQLRRYGLCLDEHMQAYQAIQWTMADGQLYLMRVRPATKIPDYMPRSGQDVGAGQYPVEVVRPPHLTPRQMQPFSWYHQSRSPRLNAAYFSQANPLFSPCCGRDEFYVCGYLYSRWHRTPTSAFSQETGRVLSALHTISRLRQARNLDRPFRQLCRDELANLDDLNTVRLDALSATELSAHLERVTTLNDAFHAQAGRLGESDRVLTEILKTLHRRWIGDTQDVATLLATEDRVSARCDRELEAIAVSAYHDEGERQEAFVALCRRFRHLTIPGDPLAEWRDMCELSADPDRTQQILHDRLQEIASRRDAPPKQPEHSRRDIETRVLRRMGHVKRTIYRHVLQLARRYGPLRRERDEPLLICHLLERDIVREVGRRLHAAGLTGSADDACLLGIREIHDWLAAALTNEELVRMIQERKMLYRRWRRYSPPSILDSSLPTQVAEQGIPVAPEDALRGRPISPGRAQGCARIVESLGDASRVLPGEILICRQALFEYTPLYGLVAAIVTERGGLLDYASVLAREYGVPAISGVKGLMQRVQDGQELIVDAYRGIIHPTPPEPAPDWFPE